MRKSILLVLPLLLGACATTDAAAPAGVAVATSEACKRLSALLRKFDIPGLSAAIVAPSGGAVQLSVGKDAEGGVIEPDAKFLSGSVGKTLVAALAIDMHNERRLDLDAPLSTLMGQEPWFGQLPNSSELTLRQLLNHTSGIPSHIQSDAFQKAVQEAVTRCAECFVSPREAIAYVIGAAPLFPAGRGYAYGETNYLLAGLAIEKAGGASFYKLLQQRLLTPLQLDGMIPSDRNLISGLASGALVPKKNFFGLDATSTHQNGRLLYNPAVEWAGGGVASTSLDLARWGHALFTGGALRTPYLDDLFTSVRTTTGRYGLGVAIAGIGRTKYYGHTGSIPGYHAVLRHYPATGVTYAVQYNADQSSSSIYDEMIEALAQPFAVTRLPSKKHSSERCR